MILIKSKNLFQISSLMNLNLSSNLILWIMIYLQLTKVITSIMDVAFGLQKPLLMMIIPMPPTKTKNTILYQDSICFRRAGDYELYIISICLSVSAIA